MNFLKGICALFCLTLCYAGDSSVTQTAIDSGNTAWVLISTALVMLMTPGLAFFYAGMVSRKNVVSTLLQSFICIAVVAVIWVVFGYSLVFSEGNGFIGGLSSFMLKDMHLKVMDNMGIPMYAFMAFQMMFAAITPAIITGSIAERVKFGSWIIFLPLWTICVYLPVAHWVWGPSGWIGTDGGLDFAGGLVIHITAGIAGLVAALMFGKRIDLSSTERANDISMVLLGGAILWFGWFGFNAGSALTSGHLASIALLNTHLGACAAFITWMLADKLRGKKPSAVSAAIGFVVGLVTITPCAGYVSIDSALIICSLSGFFCNLFTAIIKKFANLDDTLDVFACHGLGGIMGSILVGFYADKTVNSAVTHDGFFINGDLTLLIANIKATVAVILYTAVVTYILIKLINLISPMRISKKEEEAGLDVSLHGEISRFHKKK